MSYSASRSYRLNVKKRSYATKYIYFLTKKFVKHLKCIADLIEKWGYH